MSLEHLFHGAPGDSILGIIADGHLRPGSDAKLYFSRFNWEPTIQYGADLKRGASFAVAIDVEIPKSAAVQREERGGVPNALIVVSPVPLRVSNVPPERGKRFGLAIALVVFAILATLAMSFLLRPRTQERPEQLSLVQPAWPAVSGSGAILSG